MNNAGQFKFFLDFRPMGHIFFVVVFGLGEYLLSKLILGRCDLTSYHTEYQ